MSVTAHESHPLDAPGGVFTKLDVIWVKSAKGTDACLHRPRLIGVDPKIAKSLTSSVSDTSNSVHLQRRLKDSSLEFHVPESVGIHKLNGVLGNEGGVAEMSLLIHRFVSVEDIGGDLHFLFFEATPQVAATLVEDFANQIPASHLDRCARHL